MCDCAIISGHEFWSIGDLRRAGLVIVTHYSGHGHPDDCLCTVDLEATARANGCRLVPDHLGMDVEFIKEG